MIRILLASIAFLFIGSAQAQDQYAKSVLDEVSKKYDGYQTIQTDFTFKAVQAEGENYSNKGKMYMNKAKQQYKIELPNQDLISVENQWFAAKEDKTTEGVGGRQQQRFHWPQTTSSPFIKADLSM